MEDSSESPPDLPSRDHVARTLDQLLRLSAQWVVKHLCALDAQQASPSGAIQINDDADT